ncbi:MAG: ribonuclease H-like domain-containing protein, partial [Pontimonas sp.]
MLISAAGGVEGLECSSVSAEPVVDVFFGDGEVETRDLDDSREEWRVLLSGMAAALSQFEAGASLDWSAGEFDQCGRMGCEWCQDAIARHDDLFRIARIRSTQRQEIRRRGINTLSAFAEASEQDLIRRMGRLTPDELRSLHTQARVQFLSTEHPESAPAIEVIDQSVLEGLAPVREGDLYLDFESDPGYVEWPHDAPFTPSASGPETWLGLEYLIGVMESGTELYRHWWSQSFSEEARRFREFLDELHLRHHNDPDFRVFHYAPYEVNALSRLAERHGYGSDIVENLVEKGVLVDLYKVVMRSIAVGSPSYSLKKLEALYFSGTEREGITQGADSVMAFTRYHELVA